MIAEEIGSAATISILMIHPLEVSISRSIRFETSLLSFVTNTKVGPRKDPQPGIVCFATLLFSVLLVYISLILIAQATL
jgi:hypothetical protein